MNTRYFFLGLLLLCITELPSALGSKEKDKVSIIRVTGIVRLVGNSPFTEIVITNSDRQWYIAKDEMYKLHNLQQQTVTVEGEESVIELKSAGGFPMRPRYELKNIKIITVH